MDYLQAGGWEKFQHYRDRDPVWIKLYRGLLDDYEFTQLADATKAHLIGLWLLAAKMDNKIPADAKWIAKRINATEPVDLEALEKAGFIGPYQHASNTLAESEQPASTEREREEEREEEEEREAEPPAPPSCPLSAHPILLSALPGILKNISDAHNSTPPAQDSKAFADAKATISALVDRDGYTPADVGACLEWLFLSDHDDAKFWRRHVHALPPLRKKKDGATKFTRIFEAWIDAKSKGNGAAVRDFACPSPSWTKTA